MSGTGGQGLEGLETRYGLLNQQDSPVRSPLPRFVRGNLCLENACVAPKDAGNLAGGIGAGKLT